MLLVEDRDYMAREMKISLESIDCKLGEFDLIGCRSEIEAAISFFVKSVRLQRESKYVLDYYSFEDCPAEESINKCYCGFLDKIKNESAIAVLDSLRHAFCSFASGGLHGLFTRQENEVWYPKVILDCELKPNTIHLLPEIITIYRGADISEYEHSRFGQSWTIDKRVANEFAYKHYENQEWFEIGRRVVLRAKYLKRFVFYADQAPEYEIAVDPSKLTEVNVV
ncbi:Uncharacterised protein [Achromobacter xylosoxidans]|nr:Uncharacterised protein [Achromobacter xylosoxidans]